MHTSVCLSQPIVTYAVMETTAAHLYNNVKKGSVHTWRCTSSYSRLINAQLDRERDGVRRGRLGRGYKSIRTSAVRARDHE